MVASTIYSSIFRSELLKEIRPAPPRGMENTVSQSCSMGQWIFHVSQHALYINLSEWDISYLGSFPVIPSKMVITKGPNNPNQTWKKKSVIFTTFYCFFTVFSPPSLCLNNSSKGTSASNVKAASDTSSVMHSALPLASLEGCEKKIKEKDYMGCIKITGPGG